jgi:hypothetical protein
VSSPPCRRRSAGFVVETAAVQTRRWWRRSKKTLE